MVGRCFNTLEDAIKTWRAEEDTKLSRSGILCYCRCYVDEASKKRHLNSCTILIPQKTYERYHKKDDDPGVLKVIKCYIINSKTDSHKIRIQSDLCSHKYDIDKLLDKHLGKKIRLGKNILVRKRK